MQDQESILSRMENIQLKINELNMRLLLTQKDLYHAKNENEELKKRLKSLENNGNLVPAQNGNIEKDFHKKEIFHKLAENYSNNGASAEQLRTLLEEYIKDIDQCIALISN